MLRRQWNAPDLAARAEQNGYLGTARALRYILAGETTAPSYVVADHIARALEIPLEELTIRD